METRNCDAKSGLSHKDPHVHTRAHTQHQKTTQQSRGGMVDHDRKAESGAHSELAFEVSQVCLRVRSLLTLPVSL